MNQLANYCPNSEYANKFTIELLHYKCNVVLFVVKALAEYREQKHVS